jgi:DNA invertase Pin-like site-specific DNA recombinase
VGYIRVSSTDQNPERQLEGVVLDRVFTDQASAQDTDRPQLNELKMFPTCGFSIRATGQIRSG